MAKKNDVKLQRVTEQEIEKEREQEEKRRQKIWRPYTKLEERLRRWLDQTVQDYERTVFPLAYEIIKYDKLFSGDRKLLMKKIGVENRSVSCYPLIASTKDAFVTNLYDVTTKSRAVARYPEAQDKTQMAQDFYDWAYVLAETPEVIEDVWHEAVLLGTSYAFWGFTDATKKYRYISNNKLVDFAERVYQPTAQHLSFFDVFTELSTRNFYQARIKAVRKIMAWQDVRNMYEVLVDRTPEKEWEILENPHYISDVDYKRIYDINNYTAEYVKRGVEILGNNKHLGDPYSFVNSNFLEILYAENDLVEVFEVYERRGDQCYFMLVINGRCYYDGVSPFPNGDPISILTFRKTPGSFLGMGVGHLLLSHQKQVNTYWNGINDAINQHIRPMYIVEKGVLRGRDGKTPSHIFWQDGQVLESTGTTSNWGISPIQFIDYQIIQLAMRGIKDLTQEAMEIVGLNSYIQWWEGKVERSAQAAQYRVGIVRSRLQPILKSLDKFNQKLFETWLSSAVVHSPDKMNVRIIGDDYNPTRWEEVKPKDIIGKFDITVENEAIRQATKEQRMQYMVTTLQSLQPYIMDQATWLPYVDFGDVLKTMFKEANFEWLKVLDVEGMKDLVDKATEIAAYKQEQEQKIAGQAQAMQWAGQAPTWMSGPELPPMPQTAASADQLVGWINMEQANIDTWLWVFNRLPWESDEEFFARTWIIA
jgi:hypothetical protein